MELYIISGIIALFWQSASGQFFREELFPEQIQQQELQLETQKLHNQLQNVTVFWQSNPGLMSETEFLEIRNDLLDKLQESQIRQQELQNLLQLRLTNFPFGFSRPRIVVPAKEVETEPPTTISTTTSSTTTTTTPSTTTTSITTNKIVTTIGTTTKRYSRERILTAL